MMPDVGCMISDLKVRGVAMFWGFINLLLPPFITVNLSWPNIAAEFKF
jgi:hypothetical protein